VVERFRFGPESLLRRCRLRSTRPFAKTAKERGTRFIGGISEIESLGHPPPTSLVISARSKAWATRPPARYGKLGWEVPHA
jgi:hypothetical protein